MQSSEEQVQCLAQLLRWGIFFRISFFSVPEKKCAALLQKVWSLFSQFHINKVSL
jgi:hypothetical protein